MFNTKLDLNADLSAVLIRADGSHRDTGSLSSAKLNFKEQSKRLLQPLSFWKRLWCNARQSNAIPVGLGLAAFIHMMTTKSVDGLPLMGLVTTAGVNYLAADFLAASSNRINAFTYADAGTGTTAESISQTGLITPWGGARVSGTGTNPSAGQYRQVATIAFNNTFAITEYGLFSAAASGTLWDRRVFSAINVGNGDSIQFTYTVTVNAGGS